MAVDMVRLALRTALLASVEALIASPALAQTSERADGSTLEEVVVTGTLIRGIAPVGTNVIGVGSEEVTASGARSSIELLAEIPQVSNFFNRVNTPTTNFGSPAN